MGVDGSYPGRGNPGQGAPVEGEGPYPDVDLGLDPGAPLHAPVDAAALGRLRSVFEALEFRSLVERLAALDAPDPG